MEVFEMADKSVRYAPEFKRQMIDLVRSGRRSASLAKEFGPTAWTIGLSDSHQGRMPKVVPLSADKLNQQISYQRRCLEIADADGGGVRLEYLPDADALQRSCFHIEVLHWKAQVEKTLAMLLQPLRIGSVTAHRLDNLDLDRSVIDEADAQLRRNRPAAEDGVRKLNVEDMEGSKQRAICHRRSLHIPDQESNLIQGRESGGYHDRVKGDIVFQDTSPSSSYFV
jgi:hypothetical protein